VIKSYPHVRSPPCGMKHARRMKRKKRKGDAGRRDYGSLSALGRFSYRQGPPLTELMLTPLSHTPSSSCGLPLGRSTAAVALSRSPSPYLRCW
jgi:hypothetical protein